MNITKLCQIVSKKLIEFLLETADMASKNIANNLILNNFPL